MDLHHLRCFVAVAEELHFTRAAARLQLAQPALSRHIRSLEHELGAVLFHRTNRSVELTDAGRVLLDRARRLLDDAERARRAVQSAEAGRIGTLSVGFIAEVTGTLLPGIISAYRAARPRVDVELRERRVVEQIDDLVNGALHVGLVTAHAAQATSLEVAILQRQRFEVAMPVGHRLADRTSVRLTDLAEERWIPQNPHAGVLFTECAKAGFVPRIAQVSPDRMARLTLVAAGVGIALDLESAPRLLTQHVVYQPIHRPTISHDLAVAWRRDRHSPLIDDFVDIARAEAPRGRQRSQ